MSYGELFGLAAYGGVGNMDTHLVAQMIQSYLSDRPLVILGSGASAPYGLPNMSSLGEQLSSDSLLQKEENNSKFFWICKRWGWRLP